MGDEQFKNEILDNTVVSVKDKIVDSFEKLLALSRRLEADSAKPIDNIQWSRLCLSQLQLEAAVRNLKNALGMKLSEEQENQNQEQTQSEDQDLSVAAPQAKASIFGSLEELSKLKEKVNKPESLTNVNQSHLFASQGQLDAAIENLTKALE